VGRRPLLVIAGWLSAAALAIAMGLAAISVLGAGLTSSDNRPRTESEVADLLAAVSPAASTEPSASTGTPASTGPSASTGIGSRGPAGAVKTFPTPGGTIIARCAGGLVQVVSMSPAQGYAVHDGVSREAHAAAEAEFRGVADDHDRVKARLRCAADVPSMSLSVRDD
jgi:hypothetical protein